MASNSYGNKGAALPQAMECKLCRDEQTGEKTPNRNTIYVDFDTSTICKRHVTLLMQRYVMMIEELSTNARAVEGHLHTALFMQLHSLAERHSQYVYAYMNKTHLPDTLQKAITGKTATKFGPMHFPHMLMLLVRMLFFAERNRINTGEATPYSSRQKLRGSKVVAEILPHIHAHTRECLRWVDAECANPSAFTLGTGYVSESLMFLLRALDFLVMYANRKNPMIFDDQPLLLQLVKRGLTSGVEQICREEDDSPSTWCAHTAALAFLDRLAAADQGGEVSGGANDQECAGGKVYEEFIRIGGAKYFDMCISPPPKHQTRIAVSISKVVWNLYGLGRPIQLVGEYHSGELLSTMSDRLLAYVMANLESRTTKKFGATGQREDMTYQLMPAFIVGVDPTSLTARLNNPRGHRFIKRLLAEWPVSSMTHVELMTSLLQVLSSGIPNVEQWTGGWPLVTKATQPTRHGDERTHIPIATVIDILNSPTVNRLLSLTWHNPSAAAKDADKTCSDIIAAGMMERYAWVATELCHVVARALVHSNGDLDYTMSLIKAGVLGHLARAAYQNFGDWNVWSVRSLFGALLFAAVGLHGGAAGLTEVELYGLGSKYVDEMAGEIGEFMQAPPNTDGPGPESLSELTEESGPVLAQVVLRGFSRAAVTQWLADRQKAINLTNEKKETTTGKGSSSTGAVWGKEESNRCENCRKTKREGVVSLRKCSGCERVMYCGGQCQKDHWPTHKKECRVGVQNKNSGV